jgi:hypothetical protein
MPRGKKDGDQGTSVEEGEDSALTFDQQMALMRARADNMKLEADLRDRQMQLETELKERQVQAQLDLVKAQQQLVRDQQALTTAPAPVPAGTAREQHRFDIYKASGLLPLYDERDVEMYLANFEKLAEASEWPREKWALILQPKLSGKAVKAVSRLSVAEIADYGVVKEAILEEYELVAEVYRLKFRACTKRNNESYADFVHFLTVQFDRWLKSENVDSFESLRQLMLKEQFSDKIPYDVKEYLLDNEADTVMKLARAADEFAAVHRAAGGGKHGANKTVASSQGSGFRPETDGGAAQGQGRGLQSTGSFSSGGQVTGNQTVGTGYTGHTQASSGRVGLSRSGNPIECWFCKGPHYRSECPKLRQDQVFTVSHVGELGKGVSEGSSEYVYSTRVKNKAGDSLILACWRDTGAEVSCLRSGSVPMSWLVPTGVSRRLASVSDREIVDVPEYLLKIESDMLEGEIKVVLTPKTFKMPSETVPLLLGNDNGPKLSMTPRQVGAVTTRRQAKLQLGITNDAVVGEAGDKIQINGAVEAGEQIQTSDAVVGEATSKARTGVAVENEERLIDVKKTINELVPHDRLVGQDGSVSASASCGSVFVLESCGKDWLHVTTDLKEELWEKNFHPDSKNTWPPTSNVLNAGSSNCGYVGVETLFPSTSVKHVGLRGGTSDSCITD